MANATVVTNVGLSIISNLLKGAGTTPKYVAWGTGTTEAAVTQTALVTPGAEDRTSGTETQQTTTTTNDTYRVVGVITCAGAGKAITEVGLFDAATDSNMFMRSNFSAINVAVADSITFTINNVLDQSA